MLGARMMHGLWPGWGGWLVTLYLRTIAFDVCRLRIAIAAHQVEDNYKSTEQEYSNVALEMFTVKSTASRCKRSV